METAITPANDLIFTSFFIINRIKMFAPLEDTSKIFHHPLCGTFEIFHTLNQKMKSAQNTPKHEKLKKI